MWYFWVVNNFFFSLEFQFQCHSDSDSSVEFLISPVRNDVLLPSSSFTTSIIIIIFLVCYLLHSPLDSTCRAFIYYFFFHLRIIFLDFFLSFLFTSLFGEYHEKCRDERLHAPTNLTRLSARRCVTQKKNCVSRKSSYMKRPTMLDCCFSCSEFLCCWTKFFSPLFSVMSFRSLSRRVFDESTVWKWKCYWLYSWNEVQIQSELFSRRLWEIPCFRRRKLKVPISLSVHDTLIWLSINFLLS